MSDCPGSVVRRREKGGGGMKYLAVYVARRADVVQVGGVREPVDGVLHVQRGPPAAAAVGIAHGPGDAHTVLERERRLGRERPGRGEREGGRDEADLAGEDQARVGLPRSRTRTRKR
jgi:hypothetical protein